MRLRMVVALAAVALAAVLTLGILFTGRPAPASASACPSGPRAAMIVHRGAGLRPPAQSAAVPLVIGLHSSESNPWGLEHTAGLDGLADQNGFVVAYLGSQTPTAPAWTRCNMSSNLAYISSSISQLTRSQNIDPARVYITGFSAGATMSFRAGCALSGQVAAIAPVSGWMLKGQACRLKRPESMMLFIGTNDAINIAGTSRLMSGYGMGAFWARLDGCQTAPTTAPGAVARYGWNRCAQASAVVVNVIAGGTHNWPPNGSGADRFVNASRMMWSFFSAHPAAGGLPVRLSSARAGHAGSRRWVRIAFVSHQAPTLLKAVLGSARRRIAQRIFHLSHGHPVAILAVPKTAGAGRYRLTLTFIDGFGRRQTIVRVVNVT